MLLISALAVVSLCFSVVYAADNVDLTYHVNPNQPLAINMKERIGKLNDESIFTVTQFPKDGIITTKNSTIGIFVYSNRLDNSTDNAVITETAGNQIRKFNIKFEMGLSPLVTDHNQRIGWGVLSAIIIGGIVTLVVISILHKSKSQFFDIIRGPNMDPSLALFQFLVWTFVVIFSFVLIYSIKILAGDYNLAGSHVPLNLLVLMGISTAVPIASTYISREYYERDLTAQNFVANAFEGKNSAELQGLRKENPVGKMLKENNKPTIARYQMFVWTFIGIFIYLFSLSTLVAANDQPQEIMKISVPDVDVTIVALMGLSSTAFLGLKAVSNYMNIREILPDGSLQDLRPGEDLSIFGKNFGEESDTVWIGNKKLNNSEKPGSISSWSDERIDLKVPPIDEGEYDLTVVKKGSSVKYSAKIRIKSPTSATMNTTNTTNTANTKPKPR